MTSSSHPLFTSAFETFREATRGLADLPAEAQIVLLQFELYQACKRAADSEERCRELQREVEEGRGALCAQAQHHHEEATHAADKLAEVKSASEEELRRLQDESLRAQHRCATLEDFCHCLLLTIERAACDDSAAERALSASESRAAVR
ncbi:MAG TPA: hypothetical protein VGY54_00400 [Polyangiaceae bacterium]|jgi:hypothetical protein|nr:hypothetical protein [Polyangiaceae bacterium]